ncbi:MAG TPA: alpha/beta family hydrolase, partial [Acidimicrobiia bacterium]
GSTGVLLAHGAGTDQEHPSMSMLREGLAAGGLRVMSFNYPYTERGSKRPDRQDKLLACHLAAADVLSSEVDRLFLAGRSMGGRMGTYLVAEGLSSAGLVLYAYPLHPPGKPEKLRISQFADVAVPMLFFQGTKDTLSRMDLFNEHIVPMENAEVELLEGAGHGYRGGGWNLETITERYVAGTLSWVARLPSGTTE